MTDSHIFDQHPYRCRLGWGWDGAAAAAARGDIVVIVDALRFSSAVAAATSRGAIIFACEWGGDVDAMAQRVSAVPGAKSRIDGARFSLSPSSFEGVEPGTRVVLPSLNGAMCTLRAQRAPHVFAGALVNASAVGMHVRALLAETELSATVVACGERQKQPGDDGELRFAVEDYLAAGAIIASIGGDSSPEALVCARAFERSRRDIGAILLESASGRELRAMGLERDVRDCGVIDAWDVAPVLRGEGYEAS